jgi:hypothetical protein
MRAPRQPSPLFTVVILDLGTYWAQRPAFRRPRPRTAAHPVDRQDHEGFTFPQVTGALSAVSGSGAAGTRTQDRRIMSPLL